MKELVRTYPLIKQKYIIVRAIRAGNESVLLWGNPNVTWHKEILEEMRSAGIQVVDTLGGGWLFVDPGKGKIFVWGKSDRFGSAPIEFVRQLLGDNVLEEEPD